MIVIACIVVVNGFEMVIGFVVSRWWLFNNENTIMLLYNVQQNCIFVASMV